ncbi:hypothetical protein [Sphingopyxis sp. DBS4]
MITGAAVGTVAAAGWEPGPAPDLRARP